MKRKIIFATNNKHKLEEVQQMLGADFELVTPHQCGVTEDIPETADTLEGNAAIKARYLYERTGVDCFADDTGLEVDSLGGAPGVYSARYSGEECNHKSNIKLLLSNLIDKDNKKARFRTVICYICGGVEHFFEGQVSGVITEQPSGEDGFGYDPIFQPDGYDITFAEMDMETKNRISHRGRAVRAFVETIKN